MGFTCMDNMKRLSKRGPTTAPFGASTREVRRQPDPGSLASACSAHHGRLKDSDQTPPQNTLDAV